MQSELVLRTFWRLREALEQFYPFPEMAYCFQIGRPLARSFPRLLPIENGPVCEPGFRVMIRQQFRLGLGNLGKSGAQDLGNLRVILLPPALEERLISRVLN